MLSKTIHFKIYNFMTKLIEVLGVHWCCSSVKKNYKYHEFVSCKNTSVRTCFPVRLKRNFENLLILNKYWVKLGALATVLSMAFDPMYQALIKIDQRPRYQNHPVASVKRALSFEAASNCEFSKYFIAINDHLTLSYLIVCLKTLIIFQFRHSRR